MKEFEYKIFDGGDDESSIYDTTEQSNSCYREGWELVGFYTDTKSGFKVRYIFKREDYNCLSTVPNKEYVEKKLTFDVILNWQLKKIVALCGIERRLTFHMSRHTFAIETCLSPQR